jgi:hypothetical protein
LTAAPQRLKRSSNTEKSSELEGIEEVAKWPRRPAVRDAGMGQKESLARRFSAKEQEALIAFRKHTLLPPIAGLLQTSSKR